MAPSCLDCPLPFGCKSDDPEGYRAWKEAKARREWFLGKPVDELSSADVPAEAERTGLDKRTIYKRLARLRLEGRQEAG